LSFAFPQSLTRQHGQTMVEYAVTLGVIVIAGVAIIAVLGAAIVSRFDGVATTIKGLLP
jgi:Flp pilus assembly pilin Flp